MCMTACQATAGTSEENHVPDTSTAAQENADNQVTEDETSGRTIVVYYSWSENTKSSKAHCGKMREPIFFGSRKMKKRPRGDSNTRPTA